MNTLAVATSKKEELIDITSEIQKLIKKNKIMDGICFIFTPHTTSAITINENADPDVKNDMLKGLDHLGFEKLSFDHLEGNSPAHLKSSIIGCSETVFIENGQIQLGTWQGIYFCEFDGPRTRKVMTKFG